MSSGSLAEDFTTVEGEGDISGPGTGTNPGPAPPDSSPSNVGQLFVLPSSGLVSPFSSSSLDAFARHYSPNSSTNASEWAPSSSTPVPEHEHTTLEMVGLAIKVTTFPLIIVSAVFGNLLVRHSLFELLDVLTSGCIIHFHCAGDTRRPSLRTTSFSNYQLVFDYSDTYLKYKTLAITQVQ